MTRSSTLFDTQQINYFVGQLSQQNMKMTSENYINKIFVIIHFVLYLFCEIPLQCSANGILGTLPRSSNSKESTQLLFGQPRFEDEYTWWIWRQKMAKKTIRRPLQREGKLI